MLTSSHHLYAISTHYTSQTYRISAPSEVLSYQVADINNVHSQHLSDEYGIKLLIFRARRTLVGAFGRVYV